MTLKEQREAARLYKEGAGKVSEIAAMYGVHASTIYAVLDRYNVERQHIRTSEAMRRRWEKARKQDEHQAVYSPDLREQYLVAEQPAPSSGVDIDAVHHKAKRKPRKRKSWWRRAIEKLFRK